MFESSLSRESRELAIAIPPAGRVKKGREKGTFCVYYHIIIVVEYPTRHEKLRKMPPASTKISEHRNWN
jgi:hypothetical protein